jgi:hypothetical protein
MTEQGWLISVREPLTAKEREIGPMPPARAPAPAAPNAPVLETIETPGTENFELTPTRFYTAVGVSRSRGRRGPYAGPVRVPLVEPLMPPVEIAVAWTETTISLTWPRQPEDAPPPPTPAVPAAATPAGAPPTPASTTPSSPSSSGSPVPSPTAAAPPVAAAPAVAATKPPAPALPSVGLQETSGTHEVYADLETEDTRDIAPPAPPATPGAKPSPAAAAALAAAAKAAAAGPAPRYGYNVYDAPASAPASHIATAGKPGSGPASQVATPEPNALKTPSSPILPLNKTMLTVTTFADPRIEFDVERCYVIRRVELSGGVAIESGASAPVCVTPRDTFPPAAPRNVQAISGGAGVSLLWDANTEPDFGGYLVLRGEAPGDKLSPLTPSPIADTSFNDTTVRRGRTYVYEVIAVDKQTPANRSAPSNRVEETIR